MGTDHDPFCCIGSGGSLAWISEHVGPHIEHRKHVEAFVGVRYLNFDRSCGQVEPGYRVERIEIDSNYDAQIRGRECTYVMELVRGPVTWFCIRLDVKPLQPGNIHRHQRIEVDVGLVAQCA